MSTHRLYTPEGFEADVPKYSYGQLVQAMEDQLIVTAKVLRCDHHGTLFAKLGDLDAIIPRGEAVAPFLSGADRDIAILSCVGRNVKCIVIGEEVLPNGSIQLTLSRKAAQWRALSWLEENCGPGTILPAQITHLASFGAFVDLGCGVISLLPLSRISFSRSDHPSERFSLHQKIHVVVDRVDKAAHRIYLSHRELLGTWLENAAQFREGETVTGIVRNIQEYGIFIELTPNLTGLADFKEGFQEKSMVSVNIRSIQPARQKIKLQIVHSLPGTPFPTPITYQRTDGTLEHWQYAPSVIPL